MSAVYAFQPLGSPTLFRRTQDVDFGISSRTIESPVKKVIAPCHSADINICDPYFSAKVQTVSERMSLSDLNGTFPERGSS